MPRSFTLLRSRLFLSLWGSALLLAYGAVPAHAFEPYKIFRGVLVLEGKIEAGDFAKLRSFLSDKPNFDKIRGGAFLASPGGNVVEAMKIGALIRSLGLTTDAPGGPASGSTRFGQSVIGPEQLIDPKHNYLCTSACFFIFVAGVYRNLNWTGRLGIHRPFLSTASEEALSVDRALDVTWRVRTLLTAYLKQMDVPNKYIDLIYSVPSNEVRWITQSEYDADFRGYISKMRDWLNAKCNIADNLPLPATAKAKRPFEDRANSTPSIDKPEASEQNFASPKEAGCRLREREKLSNQAWQKLFGGG